MKIKLLMFGLAFSLLGPNVFAENYGSSASDEPTVFNGFGQATVLTSQQMQCILTYADWKPDTALATSDALEQALVLLKKDGNFELTRTSMLHFLAQISAESGNGKFWIELKPRSAAITGYGPLQVTGEANLKAAAKCMNQMQPGLGNNVVSSPATTVGNPQEPLFGAAASLCWWRDNMINNRRHERVVNEQSGESARMCHEIVNTGHIGGNVTGGSTEVEKRQQIFNKIVEGERRCR